MSSSASDDEPVPSVTGSFKEYEKRLQSTIVSCAMEASRLPPKADLLFQRTLNRKLAKELDTCSARILAFANQLLQFTRGIDPAPSGNNQVETTRTKSNFVLKDEDDVVENYHALVVDAVDGLLENADRCIDEFSGNNKKALAVPLKPIQETPKATLPRLDKSVLHASYLSKPQEKFKPHVDNTLTSWKPTLQSKAHAIRPLSESYALDWMEDSLEQLPTELPPHPYRYEISHITYPVRIFQNTSPQPPSSFEDTPFTWVDKPSQVSTLLSKLKNAREIAIDLEYHSYRSYRGFVCLMQISTREEDWVVDTLALRNELHGLCEVFADPNVLKVLHGAESDVTWLQQDFNLYLVNMFDTYHASVALGFPRHSLAHLLSVYCEFTADKRYQMADWRIRPLPEEMLHYARSDTHFLLFVYDNLRNALLERGSEELVRQVLSSSERTALNVCSWEGYDPNGFGSNGWLGLARRWNRGLFGAQQAIFTAAHAWRDKVAREEDESTSYVLPNHFLFKLAERPPTTPAALLGTIQPPTPIVRVRIAELLKVILDAHLRFEEGKTRTTNQAAQQNAVTPAESTNTYQSASVASSAAPNLWELPSKGTLTASSSSLFGPPKKSAADLSTSRFAASSSTLFSKSNSSLTPDLIMEAMNRIHKALALTTRTYSRLVETSITAPSVPPVDEPLPPQIPLEPEQLPFVPASSRITIPPKVDEDLITDDTIAVVGTSRQKKRKRDKQKKTKDLEGISENPVDANQPPSKTTDIVPDFDYSTAPNILDQPAPSSSTADDAVSSGMKKRKVSNNTTKDKAKHSSKNEGFGPTPRPTHEPRSGNKSRTFK